MQRERQVLFWLGVMLALLVVVLMLKDVMLPFITGLIIAYFLSPVADRLTSWGMSRGAASALIVAGGGILVIATVVLLVPMIASQMQQLAAALPGEASRLRDLLDTWARERLGARFPQIEANLDSLARELSANWATWAGVVAKSLWSQGLALFNLLSLLLVTPLVVFYLLVDWHAMLARIDSWLPREHRATIQRLAGEVNEAVSAFIRGQGTVCIILGLFYAALLSWVGLRYGLVIGLATGLLAFVPFVGWALGLLVAAGLAIAQFWPATLPIGFVVGTFFAGMAIDTALLSPRIVGSKIGLHPVWLIFALMVFSYLFGFVGMLVAVPVAAAVAVLVRYALQVYLESSVYSGGAGPGAGGTGGAAG